MVTLYHGTAQNFALFDTHYTLRGREPNSGLGVHLTDNPGLAAHYARLAAKDVHGGEPVVLCVEAELKKIGIVSSMIDYIGRDPEVDDVTLGRTREEFVSVRLELQAAGYDGVTILDAPRADLSNCWAIFDATKLSIVNGMSPEEAEKLEVDAFYPEIDFEEIKLFPAQSYSV